MRVASMSYSEKIDSTIFSEKVVMPSAGGFLLALLIFPLVGIDGYGSGINLLIGLFFGSSILFMFRSIKVKGNMGELERRNSEKSGFISFAVLLTLLAGYIAWKRYEGLAVDSNLLYISASASLLYHVFRAKQIWPEIREIVD